jgi:methyltransferase of ATP-grasp peptide maturase system
MIDNTTALTGHDTAALRQHMADKLAADGNLHSPSWRQAVLDVPRHEFLRGGFFRRIDDGGPTAWEPVMPEDDGWPAACYSDESLVTQIASTIVPADIRGRILRQPTSSSTLPGLVVHMLEELNVEDGMRVLEIGTGTGYSTALLCHRLGEDNVTSIEVDADISARARNALATAGYFPELVVGDGLDGHPDGAPYDRTIATCGILSIPPAWLDQTRPGGQILATLCGWLHASELARLTVHDDGTAHGQLLGGGISFMLARPHLPPPLGMLPDLNSGEERTTDAGPDILKDWTARFVAQIAAPRTQHVHLTRADGSSQHVLLDTAGPWAALHQDQGTWIVRQGGVDRLWDRIEEHIHRWEHDGSPGLEQFTVTAGPDHQTITWSSPQ